MHPEDRKRIGNWLWRIQHLYKIKTKEAGKLTQMKLRPIQRILAKLLPYWNYHLVLKARQEGVSTFFLIWHLDATMFSPNTNTCILADSRENLAGLFQIIKLAYESCPDEVRLADGRIWKKPKAKYDTKNELTFEGINSTIYVALRVRSRTVHRLHVSEWAFIKNAEEVLTATFQAVPKSGIITAESTADGMGGSFYEEWYNEDSRFMKHFFGFQDDPDYSEPVEDEAAFAETLTADERKYLERPGMTLGNIKWMRQHLSIAANRKKFNQEYPSCAEEAFLTSGVSPFNREKIMDWPTRSPIEEKMEGRLKYWVKPIKDRRYLVSVDSASGDGTENLGEEFDESEGGTDYSVIQVWDCITMQLVAMFRAKWPYAKLHRLVHMLGTEYNMAYVAIETLPSAHGLTVVNNLVQHVSMPEDTDPYPQWLIHTTKTEETKTKRAQKHWGWHTTAKTKPLIIDKLTELIEEEEIKVYSQKVQTEALRFIINEKGQYEAMEGYKDDCVMATAIAMYLIPDALRAGRRTASKEELGIQDM